MVRYVTINQTWDSRKQTETTHVSGKNSKKNGAYVPGGWYDICFPRLGRCEFLAVPAKVAVVLALGAVLVVTRCARRLDARIQVEIGGELQEKHGHAGLKNVSGV
jgi:hypothetical protein